MFITNEKLMRASLRKLRKMGSKAMQKNYKSCCLKWCFWLKTHKENTTKTKYKSRYGRLSNEHQGATKRTLDVPKDVPKGHMVVYVGENVRRFVTKISLLQHPLFIALLDLAREEHDDSTPSKLWIPCSEAMFLDVVRCASSPNNHRSCWKIGPFGV